MSFTLKVNNSITVGKLEAPSHNGVEGKRLDGISSVEKRHYSISLGRKNKSEPTVSTLEHRLSNSAGIIHQNDFGGREQFCERSRTASVSGLPFLLEDEDIFLMKSPQYSSEGISFSQKYKNNESDSLLKTNLSHLDESLYQRWLSIHFSTLLESSPPSRQKQESERPDDYYVNVGYAIRTIREELPNVFYKDINYELYR